MKKYNPDESITCPKCGKTYKAEVMAPKYYESNSEDSSLMVLTCPCNFWLHRRPLDYEGDD